MGFQRINLPQKGRYNMERQRTAIKQSTNSATLADVLERIRDKGLVIAGDIKIKLVDIELLTIQIRLVICSVRKRGKGNGGWTSGQQIRISIPV